MRRGPTVGVAGPATAAGVTNACISWGAVLHAAVQDRGQARQQLVEADVAAVATLNVHSSVV